MILYNLNLILIERFGFEKNPILPDIPLTTMHVYIANYWIDVPDKNDFIKDYLFLQKVC